MQNHERQCPLCQSGETKLWTEARCLSNNTHKYFTCLSCNSVYLWPKPLNVDIQDSYDESYYGEEEKKFTFPGIERVLDHFRNQRARIIAKYTKGRGKILDIGCGNGRFLHLLGQKGDFELLGSELPGKAASRAQAYSEIKLSTTGHFHEAANEASLDAVSMVHVIEHLAEPNAILEKIHKALKPGGYFFVSFPNIRSQQARKFRADWLHLDPPHHLVFPSDNQLESNLESLGFQLISKSTRSIEQNAFGYLQSYLNRISKKKDLLYESLKGNKAYTSDSSKITLNLQRLFLVLSLPFFMLSELFRKDKGMGASLIYLWRKQK